MKTFKEPLDAAAESRLISAFLAGDENSYLTLIEHNLRLVAHFAKKYSGFGKDFDELLSIGSIGLMKALKSFNPEKNIKLSSFAGKCIENEILMYFRSEKKRERESSIYEPIGCDSEGNTLSLMDVLTAETDDFVDLHDKNEKLAWLAVNISKVLSPEELSLIAKRYGLLGNRGYTQRELSEELGISRSYISRIEKRCLEKLRTSFENRRY